MGITRGTEITPQEQSTLGSASCSQGTAAKWRIGPEPRDNFEFCTSRNLIALPLAFQCKRICWWPYLAESTGEKESPLRGDAQEAIQRNAKSKPNKKSPIHPIKTCYVSWQGGSFAEQSEAGGLLGIDRPTAKDMNEREARYSSFGLGSQSVINGCSPIGAQRRLHVSDQARCITQVAAAGQSIGQDWQQETRTQQTSLSLEAETLFSTSANELDALALKKVWVSFRPGTTPQCQDTRGRSARLDRTAHCPFSRYSESNRSHIITSKSDASNGSSSSYGEVSAIRHFEGQPIKAATAARFVGR